jgi:dienelactone hydrolase
MDNSTPRRHRRRVPRHALRWSRSLATVVVTIAVVTIACGGPAARPTAPPVARPASPPASPAMLAPGPHAVGFRATWTFDPTRPYRTAFDHGVTYGGATGAPRPILVNVWYPAAPGGAPTNRAAYLQPPDRPEVHALAAALAAYERAIVAEETFGGKEPALSPELRQRFAAYLAAPLTAVRDAPPAPGRYPVLLYHAGAGSSYEDNAELCEHLASHGYVVLGSAYLQPKGDSFNIGEGERDFDALIGWAQQLPFADTTRVGGFGHSAGAHAMLEYATGPHQRIRAFALLDTTMDYYGIVEPMHANVPRLLAHRAAATAPLLVVAKPHAYFALPDELTGADRSYVTIRELSHNEYLAQGVARSMQPDVPAERAPRVLAAYRAVTGAVLAFFDRELRGDRQAAQRLAALAATPLNGDAAHLEVMPRGAHQPPPYDDTTGRAPSPRELRPVLAARGAAATIALLRARQAADPANPVYTSDELACSVLYELLARGQRDDAVALFAWFHELHPDLADELVLYARLALGFGHPEIARRYIAAALTFAPDHARARAFAAQHP